MKTLTTMTAVAALIAGLSVAGAQTNDGKSTNPSSINAAPIQEGNTGKSGMQPKATKDMPGASGSMKGKQGQQAETTNPANPNAAPTQEGNAGKSGMQPKSTADMPSGTAPRATTGTSAEQPAVKPSSPSAKPLDNAGGTGK